MSGSVRRDLILFKNSKLSYWYRCIEEENADAGVTLEA